MIENLRPMNLGGILDRGVQIFRARYQLFFGLAFIPGLAQLAYQLATVHPKAGLAKSGAEIGLLLGSYFATLVFWCVHLVLQAIAQAAICLAASRVHLGEQVSFRAAFGAFTSKAGRLVGLTFLQGIFAFWPLVIVIFIGVIFATATAVSGTMGTASSQYWLIPLVTLGMIPCMALYTRYVLAFPVTAIEGLSATSAIERSVGLSAGGRWRIFWGLIVPAVPPLMIVGGVAALIAHFKAYSPLLAGTPIAVAGINGVITLISSLLFTPYNSIVHTLLYYDQRIRREGYDVEQMMHSAGLNAELFMPAGGEAVASAGAETTQA